MSHKCINPGCRIWVNDDRQWCTSCEKLFTRIERICGDDSNGKEVETLGEHPDNGNEPRVEER